jgi:hypothetical protein
MEVMEDPVLLLITTYRVVSPRPLSSNALPEACTRYPSASVTETFHASASLTVAVTVADFSAVLPLWNTRAYL